MLARLRPLASALLSLAALALSSAAARADTCGYFTNFDPGAYLACNPDVAAAGMDPCFHFTHHGELEGRTWQCTSSPSYCYIHEDSLGQYTHATSTLSPDPSCVPPGWHEPGGDYVAIVSAQGYGEIRPDNLLPQNQVERSITLGSADWCQQTFGAAYPDLEFINQSLSTYGPRDWGHNGDVWITQHCIGHQRETFCFYDSDGVQHCW